MKITNIRNLRMAFTPKAVANRHQVRIADPDVGIVITELDVPTGKAFLWYVICMEVQTDGFLRIGERISVRGIVFEVGAQKEGWYEISTSEIKAPRFEMWGMDALTIDEQNCKI